MAVGERGMLMSKVGDVNAYVESVIVIEGLILKRWVVEVPPVASKSFVTL